MDHRPVESVLALLGDIGQQASKTIEAPRFISQQYPACLDKIDVSLTGGTGLLFRYCISIIKSPCAVWSVGSAEAENGYTGF